jgi:hypothetical protein
MAALQTLLGLATLRGSRPTTGCILRSQPDRQKLTYTFDLTHNEVAERAAVREIKIEGSKLTIVNEPAPATIDGKMSQTTTVWEKVE